MRESLRSHRLIGLPSLSRNVALSLCCVLLWNRVGFRTELQAKVAHWGFCMTIGNKLTCFYSTARISGAARVGPGMEGSETGKRNWCVLGPVRWNEKSEPTSRVACKKFAYHTARDSQSSNGVSIQDCAEAAARPRSTVKPL